MPRQSPHVIELIKAEREELATRARRYTSPYRDVIRAKIVLLAAQGVPNDVIASRLDTARQIVSKWRKRFYRARLPGLEEEPRGGRPARFSPPAWSSRSRLSSVNCRRAAECHWHAGRSRSCGVRWSPRDWSRRSSPPAVAGMSAVA